MNKIQKQALTNSLLTALYIAAVGSFMYWGGSNKIGQSNEFLVPITFLMLFVFSAAITSFLIFGKSAQLYVDGKKKEALSLISYTLGFFAAITLISLIILVLLPR